MAPPQDRGMLRTAIVLAAAAVPIALADNTPSWMKQGSLRLGELTKRRLDLTAGVPWKLI